MLSRQVWSKDRNAARRERALRPGRERALPEVVESLLSRWNPQEFRRGYTEWAPRRELALRTSRELALLEAVESLLSRMRSRACSPAYRPSRRGRQPAAVHCPPVGLSPPPPVPFRSAGIGAGDRSAVPGPSTRGRLCQARLTPTARALNTCWRYLALICVLPSPPYSPLSGWGSKDPKSGNWRVRPQLRVATAAKSSTPCAAHATRPSLPASTGRGSASPAGGTS